ncbi:cellulose biosynthesis cyclic di-GMP-binding regulatory protein BcsB [Parapusillimonas granuli]|uniref:Cyclic di-GMP-binding protein n=1 Tax=Parapusillimonas granuli TaxID=380911 RepID=A0A853FQC1_9BURK|nr:hypothetical protein [Parapusillimonas granuli]MEB2401676.1 cellulose biosynthesis cyclic di-GMP-binding regulatory protein BcsB [Alcaligenaceae bacterium]NYT47994.1 cellulose biosynthesis cyclic di-GMP-binding regulatory protein BcsB [Parapusillimonas granuli]
MTARRSWRFLLAVLLAAAGLGASPAGHGAADGREAVLSKPWGERSHAIELRQLGSPPEIDLLGAEARRGLYFGLRADERVKRARLELSYSYSRALLETLSHLNVLLNGEVVDTIALTRREQGGTLRHTTELPTALLRAHNQLDIQLVAHYTLGCEDPLHPDLWARIDQGSRLLLDVDPVALPNELALLPAPFFDARDMRRLDLPIVLSAVNDDSLQAAGVVASWFGALADYRGVRFSAHAGQLPQHGHAVLILGGNETPPGLAPAKIDGPTVSIMANPNDPMGKLLVIAGRNGAEVRTAAAGLVLGSESLAGPSALLTQVERRPRKPYDAPNWVPVDRPLRLGELLPPRQLTADGRDPWPIHFRLRVPPDLSAWGVDHVPLNLTFHYANHQVPAGSRLDILLNGRLIKHYGLDAPKKSVIEKLHAPGTGVVRDEIKVPLYAVSPDSSLQFKFRYLPPAERACSGNYVDTRRSAIDPDSTLDLTGLTHHLAMPDLGVFNSAGFPFSRMADLSESMVLLPPKAGESVVAAYLNVLGAIGEATAYPAVGVTVTSRPEPEMLKDKDVLIIGGGSAAPMLDAWSRHMPVATARPLDPDTPLWTVGGVLDRLSRLLGFDQKAVQPAPDSGATLIAGFESPVTRGRSVVVMNGASDAGLLRAASLIAENSPAAVKIQGSIVMLDGDRFEPLSEEKTYYVGDLGPFASMQWFFARHPLMLVFIYMLGALLVGTLFYVGLRARAERRLRGTD